MLRNRRFALCFIVIFVSVFLSTSALSATTIVIIRTDVGFVAAADSALSTSEGEVIPQFACKVFATGNSVVWGFGGLMGASGFSPRSELRKSIRGQDLEIDLREVRNAIIPLLTMQAQRLRFTEPSKFNFLLSGNDIFNLFMATQNRAILEGYKVSLKDDEVTVSVSGTIDCIASNATCSVGKIMRIGEDAEIRVFFATRENVSSQFSSYAEMARFLVDLEAKANPRTVRPPIDVVELTKEGVHWVRRKSECTSDE